MKEEIKKRIDEELLKISPEKRDAINLVPWIDITEEICIQHGLTNEETEDVEREVGVVILGLRNYDNFLSRIEDIVAIDELAEKLVADLTDQVFEKIAKKITPDIEEIILKKEEAISLEVDLQFGGLPQRVQKAINLSGWKKSLFQIAEKNKFNIEQSGIFEDLTIKSMRNEISSGEYRDQIKTQLSLDENKTSEVVAEVNEKIFQEIRNIMRESEVKKDDDFESFSDINDVPVPPYAKKEEPMEIKINNTSPEKIIGVEHEKEDDTPSITRKTELSAGGIQSTDFSIPKPIINDMKNINDTSLAKPSKSHDPYREII